jgi:hypothetical protein
MNQCFIHIFFLKSVRYALIINAYRTLLVYGIKDKRVDIETVVKSIEIADTTKTMEGLR